MSGGSLELQSSNFSITNEKDDNSSKTDFVDAREDPEGYNPTNQSSWCDFYTILIPVGAMES